jgi:DNA-binding transcriptional LysR family regulator
MVQRVAVMWTLVAVEGTRRFSAAGRRLGVSASLASRQIARLERELGTALVTCSRPSLDLTLAGTRYAKFAARILGEISNEDSALATLRERAGGALAVIAPKWIGPLDLGEAVAEFAIQHPRITVRFDVGVPAERSRTLIEASFDVAFQTRRLCDSSLKARKVASLPFVVSASPKYLARAGDVTSPRELSAHRCLLHENDPVWRFADGSQREQVETTSPAFTSNTDLVLNTAALVGLGFALLLRRPIQADLLAVPTCSAGPPGTGPAAVRRLPAERPAGAEGARLSRLHPGLVQRAVARGARAGSFRPGNVRLPRAQPRGAYAVHDRSVPTEVRQWRSTVSRSLSSA